MYVHCEAWDVTKRERHLMNDATAEPIRIVDTALEYPWPSGRLRLRHNPSLQLKLHCACGEASIGIFTITVSPSELDDLVLRDKPLARDVDSYDSFVYLRDGYFRAAKNGVFVYRKPRRLPGHISYSGISRRYYSSEHIGYGQITLRMPVLPALVLCPRPSCGKVCSITATQLLGAEGAPPELMHRLRDLVRT